ncbi:MAG: DUF87 domain-containing protein [Oceanospirillaceae bacterium]|nr:DUF87 domain-containing protein [Oceanospirillaceae bacterium]
MALSNPRTRKPSQTPNTSWIQLLSWRGYHLALLAFSVYLLIVLVTFDAADPSFSQAFDVSTTHNAGGTFGAILSDLLLRSVGIVAYLIPVIVIEYEIRRFLGQKNGPDAIHPWFKLLTFAALVVAFSVFAAVHFSNQVLQYPQGSGGLLGLSLGQPLHHALGMTGTNILVLTTLMLAISQFWQLRWGVITETLGRHCIYWYLHLKQSLFSAPPITAKAATKNPTPAPTGAAKAAWYRSAVTRINQCWQGISGYLRGFRPSAVTPSAPIQAKASAVAPAPRVNSVQDLSSQHADFSHDEVAAALSATPAKAKPEAMKARPAQLEVEPTPITAVATPVKEVKIVPLSETHKQDTGDSHTEQNQDQKGRAAKQKGLPSVSLLDPPSASLNPTVTPEELASLSQLLEAKLLDFGVVAEVVEGNPGPVITRIEIQPAPGTKVSKISNLSKDLARSMAVMSVRVVEVIAGKSVIGIEIPNQNREMVRISEVVGSKTYLASTSPLTLTLGNDIAGKPVVVDLAKMPHLLVAGTTGSGKSVGVNAMIMSILLKSGPDQVRMLLVDPKMLELSIYDGIPHLLAPVITDMKEAAGGLRWCVAEMERRYRLMASQGVRNLAGFNTKITAGEPILDPIWVPNEAAGENPDDRPFLEPLPYIVVVVDEFADMIMVVGKKVEELIARIAQKARAAGIHLILATQRPSVDVITGLIKANVPTRIAFQVSSKIDSRTILDQGGAESLLGHGDMLYLPPGKSMPERVHGAFVSDDEVHRVVEAWKQRGAPNFIEAIVEGNYDQEEGFGLTSSEGAFEEDQDRLYDEAVAFITETRRASISSVQRKFKIGYNRAARIIESMEAAGVITPPAHNGSREVLVPPPPRD